MKQRFSQAQVLVIGGAGFVGSNLVQKLLNDQASKITVIDNLLSSERMNLPDDARLEFIHASITDDDILLNLKDEFDYVFHLATFHGNQNSIADPLADHENNTLTTLKLFNRICDFKRVKKIVYSSAGCVVAEKTFEDVSATSEDASISPFMDSPYQISKIIGEFYANYYFKQYKLPIVKARFQNVYGPGEVLGAGQWRGTYATVWRNVIPSFVYKALKNQALTVENGGIATRDFIFVEDIVEGLILCALKGEGGEVYNLASGEAVSILNLANMINDLTGNKTPLDYFPKRDWDNSGKRFGSTEKALHDLGFQCQTDLNDGLLKTIEWTKSNLDFIETCIAHHHSYFAKD